jgi:hypothetical protein
MEGFYGNKMKLVPVEERAVFLSSRRNSEVSSRRLKFRQMYLSWRKIASVGSRRVCTRTTLRKLWTWTSSKGSYCFKSFPASRMGAPGFQANVHWHSISRLKGCRRTPGSPGIVFANDQGEDVDQDC